jgi:uncharacterized phage protein (TIGR02220 family)
MADNPAEQADGEFCPTAEYFMRYPSLQWYPADILSSARVAEMTLEEEGAYRRALDFCWLNGDLPADTERLARVIGKNCTLEVAAVVAKMFLPSTASGELRLIHQRLDEEREKRRKWSDKSREGGEKTAEKRRQGNEQQEAPVELQFTEKGAKRKFMVDVLAHLNGLVFSAEELKDRKGYRPSDATQRLIDARLNDGYKLEDFQHVHTVKTQEWKGTDMEKFLRPATLYSNKFEGYRNQKQKPNQTANSKSQEYGSANV